MRMTDALHVQSCAPTLSLPPLRPMTARFVAIMLFLQTLLTPFPLILPLKMVQW